MKKDLYFYSSRESSRPIFISPDVNHGEMTAGAAAKWFSIKNSSKVLFFVVVHIDQSAVRLAVRPSVPRTLGQQLMYKVALLLLLGSANWCVIFP